MTYEALITVTMADVEDAREAISATSEMSVY